MHLPYIDHCLATKGFIGNAKMLAIESGMGNSWVEGKGWGSIVEYVHVWLGCMNDSSRVSLIIIDTQSLMSVLILEHHRP